MGLFDLFKKQFIDVIEWTEDSEGTLAYRYPMADQEIQNGAQLTVRDSQVALFVNEGEVADVFEPGRHVLTTKTLPILTSLKHWDKLFQSPFKSDVYFFSTRDQIDQRWGTANPITIRDKEFGAIRIRAHGTFTFKIKNPKVFYKRLSGTRERYTTAELDNQLRSMILTSLSTFFGSAELSFIDMAGNQTKFSETLKTALSIPFTEYGLALQSFFVQSISLPEELQGALDKAASMRMVGDLRKYAQFQSADSISTAAANTGGAAGIGAGMGAGMAIGNTMSQAFSGGGTSGGSGPGGSEDPIATLGKLHELLTKGVISQAEFDAKKSELLKKVT
jgi:membrane protease subunit (stomatin/prohibitin family)